MSTSTINEANRLGIIIEAITSYSLGVLIDDAENYHENRAWDLAESLGGDDASTRHDDLLNPKTLDDCLPVAFASYPALKSAWEIGWERWVDQEFRMAEVDDMQRQYPDVAEGHTLFCPHGHNAFGTTRGYDECAACGALMLPDSEEEFYDSLISAGACM